MKITANQLKKIIKEETKKLMREEDRKEDPSFDEDVDLKIEELISIIEDHWMAEYDEGDPTMSHEGESSWLDQCTAASEALGEKISQAITTVDDGLFNGEYFTDR